MEPPRPSSLPELSLKPKVDTPNPTNSFVAHFQSLLDRAPITDDIWHYQYTGDGTLDTPFIVEFIPGDSRNPVNFSTATKWTVTLLQAIATFAVTFVSTAYSAAIFDIMLEFSVSSEIAILGVSLFVLGFAIGPLLWAPLSEVYGRQIPFIITYFALTAFNAGSAAAQNIETLIICRFLSGAFGSSPLTNSGGVIADLFLPAERGLAAAIFATAPFLGPTIGPIVGGFLGAKGGWRWIQGLLAMFTGVILIACTLFVPETYAPVILRRRAAKMSHITGMTYISKFDADQSDTTGDRGLKTALIRPLALLFREPIIFFTSLYIAVVYGILYMMVAAFPIVFQVGRGWSPGVGGLAFLGMTVGIFVAIAYAGYDNKRYMRILAEGGGVCPPEARLPPAILGSFLLPIGLFWFAWTNGPDIHWAVPIIASGFFAVGLVLVFLSLMGYLIDAYDMLSASVLAANSVLRSLFGAAFPLFTPRMYDALGTHWGSSIPAFLALACVPVPLLFYRYGAAIRSKGRYYQTATPSR